MSPWHLNLDGIPPEQVMGSMLTAEYISDAAGPRVGLDQVVAALDNRGLEVEHDASSTR